MYDYFVGVLTEKDPSSATLEVSGVGYRFEISANSARLLPASQGSPAMNVGEGVGAVRLFAVMQSNDSGQRLFGFVTAEERQMFRLLQAVRGVGPSLALSILSHEIPERLLDLLRSGDPSRLTRIKGIGRKTAERLLVELKDRLPEQALVSGSVSGSASDLARTLVGALVALGLGGSEAEALAERTLADSPEEQRVEELLRSALQRSARGRSAGR